MEAYLKIPTFMIRCFTPMVLVWLAANSAPRWYYFSTRTQLQLEDYKLQKLLDMSDVLDTKAVLKDPPRLKRRRNAKKRDDRKANNRLRIKEDPADDRRRGGKTTSSRVSPKYS